MSVAPDVSYYSASRMHHIAEKNKPARDVHPTDHNLYYAHHFDKHPLDILFEKIEAAAKRGENNTLFTRNDLKDHLVESLVSSKRVKKTYTTGHLWWKKTIEVEEDVEDSGLLKAVLFNVMQELELALWNKGYDTRTIRAVDACAWPYDKSIICIHIEW